ncbi:MAG: acyl carrier protein [Candidatus Omnitrophica bacterium]|nr:acyl carrier protein [Candidatus Omnitrophota bacterium]
MQEQQLENEIRNLIAEIIEKKPEEVTPDAKFFEDLGVDSMMALEIMAAIEKKYKIAIPEEKLSQLTTLRETIRVAKEYLASGGKNA